MLIALLIFGFTVSILGSLVCIFQLYRINVLHRHAIEWIDMVHKYILRRIETGDYHKEPYGRAEYTRDTDLYNYLDLDKWLRDHLECWNLRDYVGHGLYDMVEGKKNGNG